MGNILLGVGHRLRGTGRAARLWHAIPLAFRLFACAQLFLPAPEVLAKRLRQLLLPVRFGVCLHQMLALIAGLG
jgi:hypothetical protein